MKKELKTIVIEQPGELSRIKMSQLAQLIEAYTKAHPELLEEFEKRLAEGGESNRDVDI